MISTYGNLEIGIRIIYNPYYTKIVKRLVDYYRRRRGRTAVPRWNDSPEREHLNFVICRYVDPHVYLILQLNNVTARNKYASIVTY